jgi:type I restriction enzyme S subunit
MELAPKTIEIGSSYSPIPDLWTSAKLGDCLDELYRYPTYFGIKYADTGVPEVRGELIKTNGSIEENAEQFRYVTEETARRFPRVRLETGDFVMSVRGTMGKIAIVPQRLRRAVITANLIMMRFNRSLIDPHWARHFLGSEFFQNELDLATSATTIKTIQIPQIRGITLIRPPLEEQHRIAEVLDTLDEAIQKTEALIKKLKAMKQGLLHDLLTRGIDENGELRDPQTHPEQFKNTQLGTVPKAWDIEKCEDVCSEIVVGIVIRPARYYRPNGVPVLRSANIREEGVVASDLVYMSAEANNLLSKSQIYKGDVLTVRTGYPGTSCVVPEEFNGANCVDLLISRPRKGMLSQYLSMWFNSDFGKTQVLRKQGGLAQQHFNVTEMKNLLIPNPRPAEQKSIVEAFEVFSARIRAEQECLDKLKLQKKGLMHDLLTGKVRVRVPMEESQC